MGDISGKKIKQKMNVNMSHTNKKPRHKLLQLFTIFLLFFPFSEKFLIQRKCFFFALNWYQSSIGNTCITHCYAVLQLLGFITKELKYGFKIRREIYIRTNFYQKVSSPIKFTQLTACQLSFFLFSYEVYHKFS